MNNFSEGKMEDFDEVFGDLGRERLPEFLAKSGVSIMMLPEKQITTDMLTALNKR